MKPVLGDDLVVYLKQTEQITDIVQEIKYLPYYGYKFGKALGELLIKNLQEFETILTSCMGCNNEEWDEAVKTIKKEIIKYKTKGIMRRVYGKKKCSYKEPNEPVNKAGQIRFFGSCNPPGQSL